MGFFDVERFNIVLYSIQKKYYISSVLKQKRLVYSFRDELKYGKIRDISIKNTKSIFRNSHLFFILLSLFSFYKQQKKIHNKNIQKNIFFPLSPFKFSKFYFNILRYKKCLSDKMVQEVLQCLNTLWQRIFYYLSK